MKQNVPSRLHIAKRQQIAFRRWLMGKGSGAGVIEYVGLDNLHIRQHIASRFIEGMSWNNYGEWVIDHIVPLRLFDLSSPDECAIAWNYQNLMPLWKKDNLYKEGDLSFSLKVLERMNGPIVEQLIERALREHSSLDKYLS